MPAVPPPPAPAPGGAFTPMHGACRDAQGLYSARLDHEGTIQFSACAERCMALGLRCDAFDVFGPAPANGSDPQVGWCGVWGDTLTAADAGGNFTFQPANGGTRVCRGDPAAGNGNTCFHRPPFCASQPIAR